MASNFCEADYAVLGSVAEFYNAVSSVTVLISLGLAFAHTRLLETHNCVQLREWLGCMLAIAVGSAVFHATLYPPLRVLEEAAMLAACPLTVSAIGAVCFGRRAPLGLLCASLATFVLYVLGAMNESRFVFFVLFASWYACVFLASLRCELQRGSEHSFTWLVRAWLCVMVGAIAGVLDLVLACESVRPFHLHAVWHVCIACSLYCSVQWLSSVALHKAAPEPVWRRNW
jgi:hypothetical protein